VVPQRTLHLGEGYGTLISNNDVATSVARPSAGGGV